MPRAVLISGHDVPQWRRRYLSGDAPAPLPYEVNALEQEGYELVVRGIKGGPGITKVRKVVEHRVGHSIQAPLRAMVPALTADVVIALLDGEGILPGVAKRWGVPPYSRRPLVVWTCWLADDIVRTDRDGRERILRRFGSADLITHLSPHETEVFVDLGIPEERLMSVTYGVSHDFYTPGDAPRDIPFLAVGQDRGRDYGTLFEAVRETHTPVTLVCRPENLAGLEVPESVTVLGPVPHREYRDLLRRAQVVLVPTHDLRYPTGSSVALEAASSGCCVAVTRTPAMEDYLDEHTAVMVPIGDVATWRTELAALRDDEERRGRLGAAARLLVVDHLNARHMWAGVAEQLRDRRLV